MLTDTMNLLKPLISSRWIVGRESLERALAEPVVMEDGVVYLTGIPEYAVRLGKAGFPCLCFSVWAFCSSFIFWGYRAQLWRRYWVGVVPIVFLNILVK